MLKKFELTAVLLTGAMFLSSEPLQAHGFPVPAPPSVTPRSTTTLTNLGNRAPSTTVPLRGGTTRTASNLAGSGRTTRAIHDILAIDWISAFPTPSTSQRYATSPGDIASSLARAPENGGWARDDKPTLVLSYDPTNADDLKIVRRVDMHPRLRVAARLFNCFRVDARLLPKEQQGARLRVFDHQGAFIDEASTGLSGSKAWQLAERGFAASGLGSLATRIPELEYLVGSLALCNARVSELEHVIVCPDCGKTRDDARENLQAWKVRREEIEGSIGRISAKSD